jgi:hypothetical protein
MKATISRYLLSGKVHWTGMQPLDTKKINPALPCELQKLDCSV